MAANQTGFDGILDNAGNHGAVLLVDSEAFPQGGVGHVVPLYIPQTGMQVTGADAVGFVHLPERTVGEGHCAGVFDRGFKERCRKLKKLGLHNHFVDAAAAFLANADAAHERGQRFIAGAGRAVEKTVGLDQGLSCRRPPGRTECRPGLREAAGTTNRNRRGNRGV
jgi:hypothetical protein